MVMCCTAMQRPPPSSSSTPCIVTTRCVSTQMLNLSLSTALSMVFLAGLCKALVGNKFLFSFTSQDYHRHPSLCLQCASKWHVPWIGIDFGKKKKNCVFPSCTIGLVSTRICMSEFKRIIKSAGTEKLCWCLEWSLSIEILLFIVFVYHGDHFSSLLLVMWKNV